MVGVVWLGHPRLPEVPRKSCFGKQSWRRAARGLLTARFPITPFFAHLATYTMDGKNIVILQGFKEYFALGFFQGALLKDPKKLLVQLGQTQAGRVMQFTSVAEIAAKAVTIRAYVREAMAAEKAGLRIEKKPTSEFPVPEELKEKLRKEPRFRTAFEALTPGRQRGYLYHFAGAKQAETRRARIKKAMPAIFAGRGFLERKS
jgi:uncharacterized protein YdeI (YjbR/CyaY-like superfamily)